MVYPIACFCGYPPIERSKVIVLESVLDSIAIFSVDVNKSKFSVVVERTIFVAKKNKCGVVEGKGVDA